MQPLVSLPELARQLGLLQPPMDEELGTSWVDCLHYKEKKWICVYVHTGIYMYMYRVYIYL